MVNLEWYRTFKAVYQTGSLTAAAKELFISQPNVGQHLSALEAHVGMKLFERKPRIVPTDYGKMFYTQIIEPLSRLENVETDFRHRCIYKELPYINIGAVKEIFYSLFAKNITRLPAMVTMEFGITKDLISKLQKNDIQFVIAAQLIEGQHLTYEPLFMESFTIVANADMDTTVLDGYLANKEHDKAEDWLLKQDWFAYSSDLAVIRRFWLQNFAKRPVMKPRYVIPDMHNILEAISNGNGMTVTANYLAVEPLKQGRLKEVWIGNVPTTNTIYLAYDKTKASPGQIEIVRQLLKPM
ncbi:DNA-binding transcriptional LysR family regulator [Chitinophaga niastensis]|uniref:DNA-binding transcriptional LysR family regulator n=1 Tax=Chitinophaga niastensis TaxID=536980 RepID=A0A2P8HQ99_CHINA|nr:LysR family transcriptional regulator [Chitinophaga niastensis]PSL48372.1 DNA-binding transcriptional LysR family regulator [Chitinophaga niastensis]